MPHNKLKHLQWSNKIYVKIPLTAAGKQWERGDEFKWRENGMDPEKVERLFNQGFLHHAISGTPKMMKPKEDIDLVDNIRELQEIARKEGVQTSTSKDRQRELIRENREKA